MPLSLVPPKAGRTPNYRVRGSYLGQSVNRTTGTPDKAVAKAVLARIKQEIERGATGRRSEPTFASAALSYLDAGGDGTFLSKLNDYFGDVALREIDQPAIDKAAVTLYPEATAATRNRQVYTPVSAILKQAGVDKPLRRPKGWRGNRRMDFLQPAQAFALLAGADAAHERFGALCTFLLYTGCRLSEALSLREEDLALNQRTAYVRRTKNGQPRTVYLPPEVMAALANLPMDRQTVFGFAKSGRLYALLAEAERRGGVTLPPRVSFHIFRHTYGAWMRRYGGLDTSGLLGTGAWLDRSSAAVYEHVDVTAEARKADLLPTRAKSGR